MPACKQASWLIPCPMVEDRRSKGGKARAAALTPEQRSEAARRAAAARWDKERLPEVVCGNERTKLVMGEIEVDCYVLDDERRVLSQRGLLNALNMARSGRTEDRFEGFVTQKTLRPFVKDDSMLLTEAAEPIQFSIPVTGLVAYGYRAEVLAEVCEVVLAARRAGALAKRQLHIAERCEILMSAFAKVGIVALVDEVTGYQYIRARHSLEAILADHISKELVPWTKQFPDDYYIEMFRLRGWTASPLTGKRPGIVGTDTMDIVYDRLAPGVKDELIRIVERNEKGKPKHKLHQRLSEDIGHPKLQRHVDRVVTLMMASRTWAEFRVFLDRALPRQTLPNQLGLPDVD